MSNEANEVYHLLVEEFKRTRERTVTIQVPHKFHDKRSVMANELKANGRISDYDSFGPYSLRCILSDDGLCVVNIEYD